jgi:hypothetical protein
MDSLSLPTLVEGSVSAVRPAPSRADALDLLIVSFGSSAAADYTDSIRRDLRTEVVDVSSASALAPFATGPGAARSVVLFLSRRLSNRDRHALDAVLGRAASAGTEYVGIVSSFRVHLGDRTAADAEEYALARAKGLGARTCVFRPGHLLSRGSRVWYRRFGYLYPLVPGYLRTCLVEGDELFAALEAERRTGNNPSPRCRVYTLLGPQRAWRDVLAQERARGVVCTCLTAASALLALLLVGHLVALALVLLARRRPGLRSLRIDTLRPRSFRELLALYNPYNYRHVKVVGYNNGVIHFGHRYPGRTVVSTAYCNRVAHAGADMLKADCGATVRRALDFLGDAGKELPVVPNYSYVCLGTAFFVPIHGSASDYCTIADTITRVVLYDPVRDRLVVARRDEPAFRDHVFNLRAEVLLLRLYLRVKPKARYFVRREVLKDATSAQLLTALSDTRPANVEVRKASAAADTVTVSRYYNDPEQAVGPVLELPRDALGRLWDRLEENAVTSFLMHRLTRHFAWHVELFLTAAELAVFWKDHPMLPLRKLQLRYLRRDGMTHSPFRDQDCVSVDLFMIRRHRRRFKAYLTHTLPGVRTNPGKHSR